MRRIPIFSTALVVVAVGIMIGLGFWQIDRLHQKEARLVRYESATRNQEPVYYPVASPQAAEPVLYRRSQVDCRFTSNWVSIAGRNAKGEPGYVHIALCGIQADKTAYVQVGWSQSPQRPTWSGGKLTGTIAPYSKGSARLVADPPVAGLQSNAKPDPRGIPNNHLAYAVQWFLFAGVALVIYALALRKRLARPASGG